MKIKILTQKQIHQVHETSLRILTEIGVKINHEEIFGLFMEAGAKSKKGIGVAKFSVDLILKSIQSSTKEHILYGRDPNRTARFGCGDQLFIPNGG